MFKKLIFILFLCFFCLISFGQQGEYILFLDEKPLLTQYELKTHFSPKALEQRKILGFNFYDLPVSPTFLT
mgnify:FL=1